MKEQGSKYLKFAIFLLVFIEVAFLTFWQLYFDESINASLLLFSGLFTGILFIAYLKKYDILFVEYAQKKSNYLVYPFAFIGMATAAYYLKKRIAVLPEINYLDPEISDVIPQIGIMVNRALNGEFPYKIINEWSLSFELYPTYLPFQWMPFSIAELLNIDYRWFAFSILSILYLVMFNHFKKYIDTWWKSLLIAAIPFSLLSVFFNYDHGDNAVSTVESLVASYYLLLCFAIVYKKDWVVALALAACLLSRYYIVLLLPLFIYIKIYKYGWKPFLQMSLIMLGLFFIFYFPFLYQDFSIFSKGFAYHQKATLNLWQTLPWQPEGDVPFVLKQGLGFGQYFLNMEGELINKINWYKNTHLGLVLLTVLCLIGYFIKNKDVLNHKLFMIGAIKIYLTIFLYFLQIPFRYLFLTPLMISTFILILLVVGKNKTELS